MLRLGEAGGGPAAVERHQHEHQPLGVEGAPAQEEGQHHCHYREREVVIMVCVSERLKLYNFCNFLKSTWTLVEIV